MPADGTYLCHGFQSQQKDHDTPTGGAAWSPSVGCVPSARLPLQGCNMMPCAAFRDQVQRVGGLDPASQLLAPPAYLYDIYLCHL